MADTVRPSLRLRQSEQRVILLVGDLVASIGAVFGALYVWREYNSYVLLAKGFTDRQIDRLFLDSIKTPVWFYLLPLIWLLLMVELYEPHRAASWRRTLRGVAVAFFIGILGYSFIFTFNQDPNSLPRIGVGGFLIIASLFTLGWRGIYIRLYTSSGLMRRVFVVGAGKAGVTLAEVYRGLHPPPFSLVGFIDDDIHKVGKRYQGVRVFGQSKNLLKLIDEFRISNLVIAITDEIKGGTFQAILDAQERGVEVTRMPIMYEEIMGRVPIHHLESDWVIRSFVDQVRVSGVYELLKRVMDIFGGLVGLAIFALVYPLAALATVIDSGLPIFYSQPRMGMGGMVFKIHKFRTMRQDAESDGEVRMAAKKDSRVTRVGYFLRRTRLDEFPQFWNVLRGEMSLVGPRAERPELVAQFQKQIPFYRARLLVKPGLTGWAQINYGYVADVTETGVKLEYDLYYIKHRTFGLDFQIVLRTVGTVLRAAGR